MKFLAKNQPHSRKSRIRYNDNIFRNSDGATYARKHQWLAQELHVIDEEVHLHQDYMPVAIPLTHQLERQW